MEDKAQTSSRILSLDMKEILVIHMSDSPFLLLPRLQSAHLHKRTDFDCVPSVPFNGRSGILQVNLSPNPGLWVSLLKFEEP